VPAKDRKNLFEHFNNDPGCRVFLSTDAGSTGLNLQTASMIINLDIPWNPAVLEQRIGRVHRYGQKNKVSVINFVSTGTIEHRMLDVLKFKTSLFEGILNNGEDSIFLADDKFRAFMHSVEELTETTRNLQDESIVPSVEIESESILLNQPDQADTVESEHELSEDLIVGDDDVAVEEKPGVITVAADRHEAPSPPEPTELISTGINFLNGLFNTFSTPEATQKLVSSIVQKDSETGKSFLKIPVENEAVVSNALTVIGQLFSMMQKTK
jgi:superfamily II DNA/RNA helicase